MAIARATLTSMQATAEWLAANVPILTSVTFELNLITVKNATNNTVFKFDNSSSSPSLKGFITSSVLDKITLDSMNMTNVDAIACDNGCILEFTSGTNKKAAVMFAMTNNNQIACIFCDGSTTGKAYRTTNIHHCARGDNESAAITTTSFTPEAGAQTTFAAFGTIPNVGTTSYTTKAFYMPMSQVYGSGFGKFIIGTDTYITNGHWCIKDGGST